MILETELGQLYLDVGNDLEHLVVLEDLVRVHARDDRPSLSQDVALDDVLHVTVSHTLLLATSVGFLPN